MQNRARSPWGCIALLLILTSLGMVGAGAQASWPAMDEIWTAPASRGEREGLAVSIQAPPATSSAAEVTLDCAIESDQEYQGAHVAFQLVDATGGNLQAGSLNLDLHGGTNSCRFKLGGDSLALGSYRVEVAVDFTNEYAPIQSEMMMRRVSTEVFRNRLTAVNDRLTRLAQALEELDGSHPNRPYFKARMAIAATTADKAEAEGAAGMWKRLDAHLDYLESVARRLGASRAFAVQPGERLGADSTPKTSDVLLEQGGLFSGGRPLFLSGAVLENLDPAALDVLADYGLNFAVVNAPAESLLGVEVEATRQALLALCAAADARGIELVVQFLPNRIEMNAVERWPALADAPRQDITHPVVREALDETLSLLASQLSGLPRVLGLSLLERPRYRFDGEVIREAFIDRIRENNPDLQELSRRWHAHLKTYDEITIWGDYPAHSYQNRQVYQYDWQSFHQELMVRSLSEIRAVAREAAPELALFTTLADTPFELGETRMGLPRESLSVLMDAAACTGSTLMTDPVYALSFPRSIANYVVQRGIAPDKAVLNLAARFNLVPDAPVEEAAAYVRTVLFEAAMAGMNGLAVDTSGMLFEHPRALEAFATTHLDLNRVAPVVHAFQQAPPEVVVLFSNASKMMDDGDPHLPSALRALEGASFLGYQVRFITEAQVTAGALADAKLLILPQTPAIPDACFREISNYIENGGVVVRVVRSSLFNERGEPRQDVIRNTAQTMLVRSDKVSTEYLHAMDSALTLGSLPAVPRTVNAHAYPLEGVRTRFVQWEGRGYLYLVNLRKDSTECLLTGNIQAGYDLLSNQRVHFPLEAAPMAPMLIRLDEVEHVVEVAAVTE
jgi:hypothetical protein